MHLIVKPIFPDTLGIIFIPFISPTCSALNQFIFFPLPSNRSVIFNIIKSIVIIHALAATEEFDMRAVLFTLLIYPSSLDAFKFKLETKFKIRLVYINCSLREQILIIIYHIDYLIF